MHAPDAARFRPIGQQTPHAQVENVRHLATVIVGNPRATATRRFSYRAGTVLGSGLFGADSANTSLCATVWRIRLCIPSLFIWRFFVSAISVNRV